MEIHLGSDAEIEEVLRGSKAVWGAGISWEEYLQYHTLIRKHAWSAENFSHLVLADDAGRICSSCKIYRYQVNLDSQRLSLAVIGAIFTPAPLRGMGYASQMLDYLLDQFRVQGQDLVMLFSDIGAQFYSRFGFRLIEKRDPVYAFVDHGIEHAEIGIYNQLPPELLEWDRHYDQRHRFAIQHDAQYWSLLSERISWHQQYLGFRDQKAVISFADKTFLWGDLSRWRMTIRKFGTASDDPEAAFGRIMAGLRAKVHFHDFSGWLPPEFERYRCLKLKDKDPRGRTLMMIMSLSERGRAVHQLSADEFQFWLADYF